LWVSAVSVRSAHSTRTAWGYRTGPAGGPRYPDLPRAHQLVDPSVEELTAARAADAAIVSTPTGMHRGQAQLAYQAELAPFVDCCLEGKPFGVDQNDGLAAMEAIDAAVGTLLRSDGATRILA